ncbi:type II secretion system protein [Sporosarcina ureilytica]|uniref:Prepilin-type N-terminal cleavage/methylation domain-containing protein n=1 Tax=Sporosarcina ureilytica TaxID=298596 RepID=A0A1D8JFV0_9BACL|nr:type II secretion system protein [Sporosarcina ureilytica]AOV07589.1 hypothetical protein BI350_08615 [Sporosarcina ureilytica]
MRNEKGITLIELLAVLAIIGLLTTLIASVLMNGMNASDRSTTNQRLQQEANYITETIRNEYLKQEPKLIEFMIDNDEKSLKMNGIIISEGYTYCHGDDCDDEQKLEDEQGFTINKSINHDFKLELRKETLSYKIGTTYSKLR